MKNSINSYDNSLKEGLKYDDLIKDNIHLLNDIRNLQYIVSFCKALPNRNSHFLGIRPYIYHYTECL